MKKIILCLMILIVSSSCSVIMAANKEGVGITEIQNCRTRAQVICTGAALVDSRHLPNGEWMEIFQVQKERGSAARAFMHGVLDVSTFGLWEVVGTPIEACTNKKDYFFIRVTYDQQENIQRMELL